MLVERFIAPSYRVLLYSFIAVNPNYLLGVPFEKNEYITKEKVRSNLLN